MNYRAVFASEVTRRPLASMAQRHPTFSVLSSCGQARTGLLKHAHGELQTPALLLYTRRGSPLYLTPDVLQQLGSEGHSFALDATQFLGNPTPESIAKAPGRGRGLCALGGKLLVVTGRDTTVYNYPRWKQSTDAAVKVEAFAGSHNLSPASYLKVASLFEPDLLVPLVDEIPADAEGYRVRTSVSRTLRWLDFTLEAIASNEAAPGGILAAVQGGTLTEQRRHSAAETAKRSGVFGYALCGFGTGETAEQRRECIEAAVSELPVQSPRLVQGAFAPDALLEAVSLGVDMFDGTYASQVTAAGCALDFKGASSLSDASRGHDDLKVNMWDVGFRKDTGPLVPGCNCFACRNHTRAYVHHLLNVHEMTAQILLELHNLHQMLQWLRDIRTAITEDRLDQLRQNFAGRRVAFKSGMQK